MLKNPKATYYTGSVAATSSTKALDLRGWVVPGQTGAVSRPALDFLPRGTSEGFSRFGTINKRGRANDPGKARSPGRVGIWSHPNATCNFEKEKEGGEDKEQRPSPPRQHNEGFSFPLIYN